MSSSYHPCHITSLPPLSQIKLEAQITPLV